MLVNGLTRTEPFAVYRLRVRPAGSDYSLPAVSIMGRVCNKNPYADFFHRFLAAEDVGMPLLAGQPKAGRRWGGFDLRFEEALGMHRRAV